MSFAKRLNAQRKSGFLTLTAAIAAVSMGTAAIPPTPASVITSSSSQSAPREFADTAATQKKKARTQRNLLSPKKSKGYDARKARRRIVMRMAGMDNTGRQWKRVRRALRVGPAAQILTVEAWRLAEMYEAGQRLVFARSAA